MESCIPWLYIITAAMLILHEMDSVYWHEWKLFRLPGGVTFFLLIHFPLLLLVFYGLLEVQKRSVSGLIFSLALALSGLAAFVIHQVFIRKGHKEFSSLLSQSILAATVIASIVLMVFTITAAIR